MLRDSALEVFLNDMRYINPRFTYLLTYLLTYLQAHFCADSHDLRHIRSHHVKVTTQSDVVQITNVKIEMQR